MAVPFHRDLEVLVGHLVVEIHYIFWWQRWDTALLAGILGDGQRLHDELPDGVPEEDPLLVRYRPSGLNHISDMSGV